MACPPALPADGAAACRSRRHRRKPRPVPRAARRRPRARVSSARPGLRSPPLTRRRAYALVAAVCALPRLAIVFHERAALLENMEKSSTIAHVYLNTGTFGYVPGHPSAYTQPFYGWFLVVVYWLFGEHWWSIGLIQTLLAVATSLVVLEVGRRFRRLRVAVRRRR